LAYKCNILARATKYAKLVSAFLVILLVFTLLLKSDVRAAGLAGKQSGVGTAAPASKQSDIGTVAIANNQSDLGTAAPAGNQSDIGTTNLASNQSDIGTANLAGNQLALNEAILTNKQVSSDYKLVAESATYELYLYEPTLSVILRNKATGALMRSAVTDEDDDGKNNRTWNAYMRSGIVITAIRGIMDTNQVDLVNSAKSINYTYHNAGFSAKIYFNEFRFGLTVDVSLDGNDFVARVEEGSIIEEGNDTYIGTVSLFPFLGYTYLDSQDGYMFIPDGSGALIHLNDKRGRYSSGFSQMIYGSDLGFSEPNTESFLWDEYSMIRDARKVVAPVFGMVHSQDRLGYLAIVEEGDKRASIEVHPNGVMVDYNRCFAKFLIRRIYVQPLNNSNSGTMTSVEADRVHSNLQVRYRLLSGDAANYSGMAVAYREYLLGNGTLGKKDTSYHTRIDFLGTDRENFLFFTRAVTMTTTDNIRKIYKELQDAGVKDVLTVFKGWQKGGYYDIPITTYKADGNIGGTTDLTRLIKESAKQGYDIYLYNNAVQANPKTNNTTFSTVKKINKRKMELDTYSSVYRYFNYLLPSKTQGNLDKFISSYTKKGVANLALAQVSNTLFSYYYGGKSYSRFDTAREYGNIVAAVAQRTNLILENPYAYLWSGMNAFLDMPVESSNFMYVDEEVPFLPMVLKGSVPMYSDYVNFVANKNEFYLKMIESGVYPSFYLTNRDASYLLYTNSSHLYSTLYDTYRETIIRYDRELGEVARATEGAYVIRHEKLDNGVNVVTYDNGVNIYVNYSKQATTVNGHAIEGMSYIVVR